MTVEPCISRLNQRVRHRAWKWTGTVVDFPLEGDRLSTVTVLVDDINKEQEAWVPSLKAILDEDEEMSWV